MSYLSLQQVKYRKSKMVFSKQKKTCASCLSGHTNNMQVSQGVALQIIYLNPNLVPFAVWHG